MYKIIGADGKEYGPIPAAQLREWLKEGRVNSQTQVQPEGAAGWQPLSALPELAAELSPPAATPLQRMAPAQRPETSGMAITSLVLGILGLFSCGATALVGFVLGFLAILKIKKSEGRLSGKGLAIAGTVVSGVFLLLFGLLLLLLVPIQTGLMLPALSKARERAQTINCVNNVKQLGLAARMYATDNNHYPSATNWSDAIQTYVGSLQPFQCGANPGLNCAFAYNRKIDGLKLDDIDPQTVLFFESSTGWNAAGGPELFSAHKHSRTQMVVGFADGSVRPLSRSEFDTLRWEP